MTILLFGVTKDIVGSPTLSIPTSTITGKKVPKTVGELRTYLGKLYPKLNTLSSLAIAVNNAYAEDEKEIHSYDEIALIPPVSGG
ncbi:MAG: MoaD/ThiS family protein [Muricauda sp.]|jgi:molybdopterin synthase sulfur carrier subunit|uniref:Molybdopterin converting factor n=1 Tax=Flagellimonas lutaonensis TaxID=516051 RepID=A0A0D5YVL3_9FLAO|nr:MULTISPECIES: MoaD/ThiS family protein [Allomuricauda]AKA36357.1 molybdopterin converting factor [Allomuricauda lutaonensis]MAU27231.1 MoaD/ThiS family protein [Allomuricauda sp.]MBC29952.1 MoaD/ThiS family protein [Allomuricauda sp.]|tara:strand:- start:1607 stop:1861 length:255 start_codon:yes stop_codon:yes gene_type:complete